MENLKDSFNRTVMITEELCQYFPEFRKILESFENYSTENTTIFKNYVGAKYFKVSIEKSNLAENGYNNSTKTHDNYIDEKGDLHILLYESIYKTEICFAKEDQKGFNLFNAYMTVTTVPTKDSVLMFKKALEEYIK